jgi:hypothetical protein
MPDLSAECAALRREIRRLLKRCGVLQGEIVAEKARADAAEAWAREMVGGKAA